MTHSSCFLAVSFLKTAAELELVKNSAQYHSPFVTSKLAPSSPHAQKQLGFYDANFENLMQPHMQKAYQQANPGAAMDKNRMWDWAKGNWNDPIFKGLQSRNPAVYGSRVGGSVVQPAPMTPAGTTKQMFGPANAGGVQQFTPGGEALAQSAPMQSTPIQPTGQVASASPTPATPTVTPAKPAIPATPDTSAWKPLPTGMPAGAVPNTGSVPAPTASAPPAPADTTAWKPLPTGMPPGAVPNTGSVPAPAAPAPAASGPTPEQLAQFRKGTASDFDPNSWVDRNKMDALLGGSASWADNAAARAAGSGRQMAWAGR